MKSIVIIYILVLLNSFLRLLYSNIILTRRWFNSLIFESGIIFLDLFREKHPPYIYDMFNCVLQSNRSQGNGSEAFGHHYQQQILQLALQQAEEFQGVQGYAILLSQ